MSKAIIILSGGMDSATMLWQALADGHDCLCLTVDYGQRHVKEVAAADALVRAAAGKIGKPIPHKVIDLRCLKPLMAGSSQTDPAVPVPVGHYAEDSMKKTVVPNRNMILIAVAAAWAISEKADAVYYGAHAGDHAIYPDCRPEFVSAMDDALENCDWHSVRLEAPLLSLTKGQIVRLGMGLDVPWGLTWTCYEGQAWPCKGCGACQERAEAFAFAGIADPLLAR